MGGCSSKVRPSNARARGQEPYPLPKLEEAKRTNSKPLLFVLPCGTLSSIDIADGERKAVTCNQDGKIATWNLDTGQIDHKFEVKPARSCCLCLGNEFCLVTSALKGDDSSISVLYKLGQEDELCSVEYDGNSSTIVAGRDGDILTVCSKESLTLFDLNPTSISQKSKIELPEPVVQATRRHFQGSSSYVTILTETEGEDPDYAYGEVPTLFIDIRSYEIKTGVFSTPIASQNFWFSKLRSFSASPDENLIAFSISTYSTGSILIYDRKLGTRVHLLKDLSADCHFLLTNFCLVHTTGDKFYVHDVITKNYRVVDGTKDIVRIEGKDLECVVTLHSNNILRIWNLASTE